MTGIDIARAALEQTQALSQQFLTGLKAGKEINKVAHTALQAAYDRALADSQAKLPTTLSLAIENVLRLNELQAANDYANASIKREKEVPEWERELRTGDPR